MFAAIRIGSEVANAEAICPHAASGGPGAVASAYALVFGVLLTALGFRLRT